MSDNHSTSPITSPTRTKQHRVSLSPIDCLVAVAIIAVLVALFLPAVNQPGRGEGLRWRCRDNLKQIGLALHSYHEKYGCFPPAYIADANGRPMHSWRVLILPFLGQQQIYDEYRFEEPWDGPHNSKLTDRHIDAFCCPAESHNDGHVTSYVAVIGPQTVWPGDEQVEIAKITDGLTVTLLIVEASNSGIHWMAPRDLHVSQMAPSINTKTGQGISSAHLGGAYVLFADGHVRFLMDSLSPDTLHALLSRNGGENVGGDSAGEF